MRIKEAAEFLNVTSQTLRNWEKSGKLIPSRSSGGQRLYDREQLEHFRYDFQKLGWAWASSGQAPDLPSSYYCERQDRFNSRLQKLSEILTQRLGTDGQALVSVLGTMVGEIGDNSFAHNLGNWPDVPGIFFAYDLYERYIVIADRGRGVKATLQRVRPTNSDEEALGIAFTEVISGRSPEQRGNGLKVVREIAQQYGVNLLFRSGLGLVEIDKGENGMKISTTDQNVRGVYAVIRF